MDGITLTKFEIARRQLKTAVRLFFAEGDCVSIETLVGASTEILRQIGKDYGVKGLLHDADLIKDEYRKKWIDLLREPRNFFKHSGKDPNQSIEFSQKSGVITLLEACLLIRHLEKKIRPDEEILKEAYVFQMWFFLSFPEYMNNPNAIQDLVPHMDLKAIRKNAQLSDYCQFLGSSTRL